MNATLQKHLDAIRAGTITKTNVIGIRKLLNLQARRSGGWSVPAYFDAISAGELAGLERELGDREPRVAGELHESGLKVLRNRRYAKRWTEHEQKIIDTISHFRLVEFQRIGRGYAVPVYRAWSADYGSFLFRNVPWQTAWTMDDVEDGPRVVQAEEAL